MLELLMVDLIANGITSEFIVVIYAEDDPTHKKAFYFEGIN
jgi:hypothetical protein